MTAAAAIERIGTHYRVERLLGTGGTSRVMEVIDERSGERMALKQSLTTTHSVHHARSFALFRQEFHVLCQLAHPNVVGAFEYGLDAGQPFYTMELLRGRSLGELAPLPWQRLCSIMLDLCSPLSMLHARRFVHCDVTARNVLVTDEGVTKLIDFGALAAIDRVASSIAGTPPHMAPELVRRQSIDGRVDMFAIGALAYSLLSGRHAYPARSIQELPQVWRTDPPSLHALGVDIPAALEQLIMSLLSLDVSARPLQLAELVHRLAAILGGTYAIDPATLRAQIATPRLVGRDHALDIFREAHASAASGRGDILCISGPRGIGRSRVLEACALEAALSGGTVVRVPAEDECSQLYGLFARILQIALAQDASIARALPELIRRAFEREPAEDLGPETQLANASERELQQCWRALSANHTAVVLIDDLARADVPSIQQLLLLSETSKRLPVLVLATIGAGQSALERNVAALASLSRSIVLTPLSAAETAQLVRSLFGDAAELEPLIAWVQRAGEGVPGACVELAHYAVERGFVRFVDGQFQVAHDMEFGAALPSALDEAFVRRIQALSPLGRELLAALSLLTPFGPLTTAEQVELMQSSGRSTQEVLGALDELRDAQLIALAAGSYELRSESIRQQASQQLSAAEIRAWHVRIAGFYAQRGHDVSMLCALHYEYGGERAEAYARIKSVDERLSGPDDPNIKLGGSPFGIALHQAMLEYALSSGAPRVEVLQFQRILISIGATSDPSLGAGGAQVVAQLREDIGLDAWDSADPALDERSKLLFCLGRAQERFAGAAPGERLHPALAIGRLAECVASLSAISGSTFEPATSRELAEQFRPLRTLAPVLGITYDMIQTGAQLISRGGRATDAWLAQLEALEQKPEGLPDLIWLYMQGGLHFSIGRDLACLADARYAQHADALAARQRTFGQACTLRLLYALAHGSFQDAARQRRERAIAALSSQHEDQRLASTYIAEVMLLDACADLLELQRTAAWLEAKAARFPGWAPGAAYARACCHLLCDQAEQAERVLSAQLAAAPPLQHALWYALRGARAEAALRAGDAQLAQSLAEDVLLTAAEAGVDVHPDTRAYRVLALARATLGDSAAALAALAPEIARVQASAPLSLRAGQLYETRARVALFTGDREAFRADYARVNQIYSRGAHPGLMARLQQLTAAAQQRTAARERTGAGGFAALSSEQYATVQTDLDRLERSEQLDYLLALLLRDAHATAGHLYCTDKRGSFVRVATQHTLLGDSELDAQVNAYAAQLARLADEPTQSLMAADHTAITRSSPEMELERFHVLALRASDEQLRGLALLRAEAGVTSESVTPALCMIVADVLERMQRGRSK